MYHSFLHHDYTTICYFMKFFLIPSAFPVAISLIVFLYLITSVISARCCNCFGKFEPSFWYSLCKPFLSVVKLNIFVGASQWRAVVVTVGLDKTLYGEATFKISEEKGNNKIWERKKLKQTIYSNYSNTHTHTHIHIKIYIYIYIYIIYRTTNFWHSELQ